MTIKQFEIFAAVARHRNVTRASEELRLSQPGVSQQLKLLEQSFGVKLLKRNGRGVDLTDTGFIFLNKITPILSQVEDLNRTFGATVLTPKVESLAVGGTYGAAATLLPSILAVFKKTHPLIELALRTGTRRTVEHLLLASEIEVAVVAGNLRSDRLVTEPYGRYRLVAIVTKNHPLAKRRKISTLELAGLPLVMGGGVNQKSAAENFLSRAQSHGLKLNVAMRCESPEAIKIAVREGLGIGLLYADAVKSESKKREFAIIELSDLTIEGETWIVYRRDEALSKAAAAFLRLLRDWRDKDHRNLLAGLSVKEKKVFYPGALFDRHPSDETPQA